MTYLCRPCLEVERPAEMDGESAQFVAHLRDVHELEVDTAEDADRYIADLGDLLAADSSQMGTVFKIPKTLEVRCSCRETHEIGEFTADFDRGQPDWQKLIRFCVDHGTRLPREAHSMTIELGRIEVGGD